MIKSYKLSKNNYKYNKSWSTNSKIKIKLIIIRLTQKVAKSEHKNNIQSENFQTYTLIAY